MWKVENNFNKNILEHYNEFIVTFFQLLIKVSKLENKKSLLSDDKYLSKLFKETKNLDERLLKIKKSKNNTLKDVIRDIILLNSKSLIFEFDLYKKQNFEVKNENINLEVSDHPNCLKSLFKDYFYDKFFGISWIWSDIINVEYSRSVFKTNFKEENKLHICSYCDIDTISSSRNGWIEHFLPKSKFPYLSCNFQNLIPTCTACNVSGSGKGEDVKRPITNQYSIQIGNSIEFSLAHGEIDIKENTNDSIENFVKLLKLRQRYREENVKTRIFSTIRRNYEIANKAKNINKYDAKIFSEYIFHSGKDNGLYFVQRDLLNHIDEI